MEVIATSKDLNNKNIEKISFEPKPLSIKFRLKDGCTLSIKEEEDKNGDFYLVSRTLKLEDGKPGDIVGRCLVGRTKWGRVKNLDILPKDAVKIPL